MYHMTQARFLVFFSEIWVPHLVSITYHLFSVVLQLVFVSKPNLTINALPAGLIM